MPPKAAPGARVPSGEGGWLGMRAEGMVTLAVPATLLPPEGSRLYSIAVVSGVQPRALMDEVAP